MIMANEVAFDFNKIMPLPQIPSHIAQLTDNVKTPFHDLADSTNKNISSHLCPGRPVTTGNIITLVKFFIKNFSSKNFLQYARGSFFFIRSSMAMDFCA